MFLYICLMMVSVHFMMPWWINAFIMFGFFCQFLLAFGQKKK